MLIKIWDADNNEEEFAEEIEAKVWDWDIDLPYIAQKFFEGRYSDSDYASEMNVGIRYEGKLYRVNVSAEPDIIFVPGDAEEVVE